ncbi:hypothetical protein [Haloprofundus salilacus]|uniref:hypothetical protein n=1 Tax=Haloprofundus salilacus TaxID=2876190 RepID=UPI001CCABE5B|nr:hypothetical protein [Haloprofundus salilacus]
MDGDGGGMDGGEMGSMHSIGMEDVNGDIEARMERTDGDPGISALQSMGYIDNGDGIGQREGDSTDSGHSALQSILITTVVVFFVGSLLYFLITGILGMLGV